MNVRYSAPIKTFLAASTIPQTLAHGDVVEGHLNSIQPAEECQIILLNGVFIVLPNDANLIVLPKGCGLPLSAYLDRDIGMIRIDDTFIVRLT
jgi:hypothetical protein